MWDSLTAGSMSRPRRSGLDVRHQRWLDVAVQRDHRRPRLAEAEDPRADPRRDVAERVGVGVQRAQPLEVRIEVAQVDEFRPGEVGLLGHRPGQLLLACLGRDRDHLPRLDVGAGPHQQLGQPSRQLGVSHRPAPRGS